MSVPIVKFVDEVRKSSFFENVIYGWSTTMLLCNRAFVTCQSQTHSYHNIWQLTRSRQSRHSQDLLAQKETQKVSRIALRTVMNTCGVWRGCKKKKGLAIYNVVLSNVQVVILGHIITKAIHKWWEETFISKCSRSVVCHGDIVIASVENECPLGS